MAVSITVFIGSDCCFTFSLKVGKDNGSPPASLDNFFYPYCCMYQAGNELLISLKKVLTFDFKSPLF